MRDITTKTWNNTVVKVAESDVPYRNDTESGSQDNIEFKYNEEIELTSKLYDPTQRP